MLEELAKQSKPEVRDNSRFWSQQAEPEKQWLAAQENSAGSESPQILGAECRALQKLWHAVQEEISSLRRHTLRTESRLAETSPSDFSEAKEYIRSLGGAKTELST